MVIMAPQKYKGKCIYNTVPKRDIIVQVAAQSQYVLRLALEDNPDLHFQKDKVQTFNNMLFSRTVILKHLMY
jgi:hypothetical protein